MYVLINRYYMLKQTGRAKVQFLLEKPKSKSGFGEDDDDDEIMDEDEIMEYLKMKKYDNCLVFWKENQSKFPELAKIACKRLSMSPSSSCSEKSFLTAGNIVKPERSSFKPESTNFLTKLAYSKRN